ncbi:hypothetical protein RZS08_57665, partial [Arthrospira platensis SPKY1]|nr:hypothetical protein [Arthrospira platensis SPKY1]
VSARAKVSAGAGKDGDGDRLIGIERLEGVIESKRGVMVDGVARLRAVDRDDADRAARFGEDSRHGRPPETEAYFSRLSLFEGGGGERVNSRESD